MTEPYSLVRSARRTISLEVREDGAVLVRAPRYYPRHAIDAFVADRADWIAAARGRIARRAAVRDDDSEPALLRARAEAELPPRLAAWAERMGLTVTAVTVTSAERRLGSCAPDGRICLSLNLLRWPEAVVDYVLVHELAHLRHRNHSPAFYAEIERYLPAYRHALDLLRGRGS